MTDKKKMKTVIAYIAGILILLLCVASAWFFPEWYGTWSDQRELEHVRLSNREKIEFLDGDSLDQLGRWKAMGNYAGGSPEFVRDETIDLLMLENMDQLRQTCYEEIPKWCESGLLPLDTDQWDVSQMVLYDRSSLLWWMGEAGIPVGMLLFYFPGKLGECRVTVIIDIETQVIYYMAISGPDMWDGMAEELGYSSYDDMEKRLMSGEAPLSLEPDASEIDFASACGAESADVETLPGSLDMDASLQFESFTCTAHRMVVLYDGIGYGMAVMYGTPLWPEILMQLTMDFQYEYQSQPEYPWGTTQWLIDAGMGMTSYGESIAGVQKIEQ